MPPLLWARGKPAAIARHTDGYRLAARMARPEAGDWRVLQPTVYSPQPVVVYEPAFLAVISMVRSAPSVETLNLISLPETWPL